mgnify:CR=1 FL=1
MKKTVLMALLLSLAVAVAAQKKNNDPTFTTVIKNPITSIKNQNRSGTCWAYATVGFLEGEILRSTGRTVDLSEMFVASKDYVDCAEYHVRMHGRSQFSEGGSCDDVIDVVRRHGICPETAMAAPGSLTGDSLANFSEFFSLLEPYVSGVAGSKNETLTTQWKVGMQGILDAYLGACPEHFTHDGKYYTPQSYFKTLGIDLDDYVSITSFTHHPLNEWFVIEAPYKWRPKPSYNIPLDQMMAVIDNALKQGYNVAWGGDVSGDDFSRQGIAKAYDVQRTQSLAGTDEARWLKLPKAKRGEILDSLGVTAPEVVPTQEKRQLLFDNWQSTYDHVMVIYGMAKDQSGREYYMVKNSWGESGRYKGTWYMSKNFIALYTTYIFLNRNALDKDLLKAVTR